MWIWMPMLGCRLFFRSFVWQGLALLLLNVLFWSLMIKKHPKWKRDRNASSYYLAWTICFINSQLQSLVYPPIAPAICLWLENGKDVMLNGFSETFFVFLKSILFVHKSFSLSWPYFLFISSVEQFIKVWLIEWLLSRPDSNVHTCRLTLLLGFL